MPRFMTVEVHDRLAERIYKELISYICFVVEFGEQIPPLVTHPSEDVRILLGRQGSGQSRPLKRSFALLGLFIDCYGIYEFVTTEDVRNRC
jgi:hypothetical protein